MFIESFIISILVGLLRKGKLQNLGLIQLKRISLLFVAFIAQFIIDYLGQETMGSNGGLIHLISYFVLFYFFYINKRIFNLAIFSGIVLNFLVVSFNEGAMPVLTTYMPNSAISALSQSVTHTVLTDTTMLVPLADIIYIPWPQQQMISIGDIFLNIGVFLLVQRFMVPPSVVSTGEK